MKSFGRLLRAHIERSGYSIYSIAKRAGLNRTTLQKILSDERTATKENMENLLPLLKLTPAENHEIHELLDRIQIGESVYSQRTKIKELLEYTSMVISGDVSFHMVPSPTSQSAASALKESDGSLFNSIYATEHLLNELLFQECQNSEPLLLANFPADAPLLSKVLLHGIHYCPGITNLRMVHLTHFVNDNSNQNPALANLDIYARVLPFIALQKFSYHVYYYYNRQDPIDACKYAFPYYIIFSNAVVLLSADGSTAMPCFKLDVIEHFRSRFEAAMQGASPLVNTYPTAANILSHVLEIDQSNAPLYCLEYQPCLIHYLNDALLRTYARNLDQIPPELFQALSDRIHQLQTLSKHVSVFSKSGVLDFIQTGRISEIPAQYMAPLSLPDRLVLLKKLYTEIETGKQQHLMINPVLFPISRQMSCILHEEESLEFTSHSFENGDYCYVQTTELTLLEAFTDFFQYLQTSGYVYTKKETLNYLQYCMESLGNVDVKNERGGCV